MCVVRGRRKGIERREALRERGPVDVFMRVGRGAGVVGGESTRKIWAGGGLRLFVSTLWADNI